MSKSEVWAGSEMPALLVGDYKSVPPCYFLKFTASIERKWISPINVLLCLKYPNSLFLYIRGLLQNSVPGSAFSLSDLNPGEQNNNNKKKIYVAI